MNLSPGARRPAPSADRLNAVRPPSPQISRSITAWAIALALGLGAASGAHAAAVTVPAGLSVGDTYRIIFVTSTTRGATSTAIADYNAHVTAAAAALGLGPGISWAALGSTQTVNVLTNLLNEVGLAAGDTTTRFYNTAGNLIATGVTVPSTGLYQANTGNHLAGILDETGAIPTANGNVWTGTFQTGSTAGTAFLGGAGGNARTGRANQLDFGWTSLGALARTNALPLYGVSGLLTVTVPEPSALALMGSALLAIGLARIRRERK